MCETSAPPTNADEEDFLPLPPVGNPLKKLEPSKVQVVARDLAAMVEEAAAGFRPDSFVELFRACTPYIKMHQGKEIVIHLSTALLDQPKLFDEVMDDVATLSILGVRPVLLCGIADQVNAALRAAGEKPRFHNRFRISDQETLRVVQQVTGLARSRVEAALARGRASMSIARMSSFSSGVNVVSSNLMYTAQPVGVRGGIDYGSSGEVRRIEVDRIREHLNNGAVVLMTGLGYSASGEVFNVPTQEVASRTAASLRASKLVFVTCDTLMQTRSHSKTSVVQSMRLAEAKALLQYNEELCEHEPDSPGCDVSDLPADGPTQEQALRRLLTLVRLSVSALEAGVSRAHLVAPLSGTLLQELYTLDGSGTLIARDLYDGIRLGVAGDVPGIIELIAPLEAAGILVTRPREELTRDVHQGFYYVLTRDDQVLSTAMLKRYSNTMAELGCLVVSPRYRKQGNGDAMLAFVERTAIAAGVRSLFALSTHTMQWFIERGFVETTLDQLPPRRQRLYNPARNSKIYIKELASRRQVDAEELFWAGGTEQR